MKESEKEQKNKKIKKPNRSGKKESEKTLQLNTMCDSGLGSVCLCVFMILLRHFEKLE